MILFYQTPTERFMKDWISPVYTFFEPFPKIVEENGRRAHVFKCQGKGCKATVRRYLDKGDARSTGNMRKHVRSCWGEEAKDANEVRKKIVGSVLRNGSITASFERKGKGKITYSHRQHTKAETKGFQSLMKTGRPEYYILSKSTVSRDVQLVFARTRQQIAKMMMEYAGRLNFSTDAWTSPNHRAFVAVLVHLEHNGVPLCFPLDVVEVPKVGKSLTERMLLIQ
ncbi:hypothetical protein P692DRAFT_201840419 [Suillus brevipes Sb2]|nr:hypothetical protein P692DRAFT_201842459 [Suillus brevipes Sb2]KAG2748124.1 hypothetical protein P692DRAFT_201840419 [Suillus brevipes Sb2]